MCAVALLCRTLTAQEALFADFKRGIDTEVNAPKRWGA